MERREPRVQGRLFEPVKRARSQRLNKLTQDHVDELVRQRVAECFPEALSMALQVGRGRQALVVEGRGLSDPRWGFPALGGLTQNTWRLLDSVRRRQSDREPIEGLPRHVSSLFARNA
jgi:hypothetical protein